MERFKNNLVVVLAVSFLFAGNVNANPAGSGKNAPAIVADAFICRPMGIIALIAGSVIYVVSLPFTSMDMPPMPLSMMRIFSQPFPV